MMGREVQKEWVVSQLILVEKMVVLTSRSSNRSKDPVVGERRVVV